MKGFLTSFVGQFGEPAEDAPTVERIEIPLIQRDYAQGRRNTEVDEVRSTFLEVLLDAVAGGDPVGLDFVYGNVEAGTFRPLDGQQRLTTLFLLHWYFGSGAGQVDATAPWTQFAYATRPSAELFCRQLINHPLPSTGDEPSAWIIDQPWYLHTWRNDPTVQGMLVVLGDIHELSQRRYPELDPAAAWNRLIDASSPVISFYFLALPATDSDEELYIKMNSRGKPLTPFENFKAHFEQGISYDAARADEFAHKIDGQWADLLWPYHGGDNIVDDEFMRYIEFVTEICELRDGRMGSGHLGSRAHATYGEHNPRAGEHLDFLFAALDCWTDEQQIHSTFHDLFSTADASSADYDSSKNVIFNVASVNLFETCCETFDGKPFGQRPFTLQQSLYLYAVLLHLIHHTNDFPRRVRTLRNLIAASDDEIRRKDMSELIVDVEHVIVNDDLDAVKRFSSNQVADERMKRTFLANHEELTATVRRLEDHPLIRGTLACFEYDPDHLEKRAQAFEKAFNNPNHWATVTGALLATGDYQRPRTKGWQFGTGAPKNSDVWRRLLTNASRDALLPTRSVLSRFLDGLAESTLSVDQNVKPDWPQPARLIWPRLFGFGGWFGVGRSRCRFR